MMGRLKHEQEQLVLDLLFSAGRGRNALARLLNETRGLANKILISTSNHLFTACQISFLA
jgi:hypothetical protein